MKKILIPVALLLATITAVTSCKKDDSAKSTHDKFIGTWKSYQHGVDSNNNGVWDANEKANDTGSDISTLVFKSDGSGSAAGDFGGTPITLPFTWNLQNNNNDLRMITSFIGTDTTIQNIVTITDNSLVLKDPSKSPVAFQSLNKQ
ncbi:MAG: hypothetical protein ABI378_01560 [Chitinophagaceae bacterium]